MNGVLESYLVSRRNNEVTCPCHPTAKPYHQLSRDYNDRDGAQTTCGTDDEERDLLEMLGSHKWVKSESREAYRESDIHTVIYNNFRPVTPDIVEQVIHNLDSLIPH